MTNTPSKKISRRDAIKLLGAVTGATVLANLPSKWSTPSIVRGVLPAHAQTSVSPYSLECNPDEETGIPNNGNLRDYGVSITPAPPNGIIVVMRWSAVGDNGETFFPPASTGTVNITGPASTASLTLAVFSSNSVVGGPVRVTWSFENIADGNTSCIQTNVWNPI